jgi:membrane protein DedA with SNARE-associated domain
MSGMRYWKFLLVDALAATLSVAVLVYVGFHFGNAIPRVLAEMREIRHLLAILVLLLAVLIAAFALRRRQIRAPEAERAARRIEREVEAERLEHRRA